MKKILLIGRILSKKEQRSINGGLVPSCTNPLPAGTACSFAQPGGGGGVEVIYGTCDGNCNCVGSGVSHNGNECRAIT
jgi:hypothetical protein